MFRFGFGFGFGSRFAVRREPEPEQRTENRKRELPGSVFQLIIRSMERTLDSTLLHLVRSRLVDDYPTQIGQCLEVMTEADMWWRPDEKSNALGNIMLHLVGSNRLYVGYGVGGRAIERDRAAEFTARGNPGLAAVVDEWNSTVQMMREVFADLEPSRLTERTDRTGKMTSIASILLHASHHTAAHMGQVVWITKMRHPGALEELWIRTRDRLASERKS